MLLEVAWKNGATVVNDSDPIGNRFGPFFSLETEGNGAPLLIVFFIFQAPTETRELHRTRRAEASRCDKIP